jgi:hypothetical protein
MGRAPFPTPDRTQPALLPSRSAPRTRWHRQEVDAAQSSFGSSTAGLPDEAAERRHRAGPKELAEQGGRTSQAECQECTCLASHRALNA